MGLDMYFEARTSKFNSFSRWDLQEGKMDKTKYPKDLTTFGEYIMGNNYKSHSTEEYYQIGYFRKFNALHNWIVKHLANDVDECQRIYIEENEAEGLLKILKEVQADHTLADQLLPTADGCFFGSLQYDEWYFNDVDRAVELFDTIINNFNFGKYDLIYQASW